MRYKLLILIAAAFSIVGCASLTDTGTRYRTGVQNIHEGKTYFAIMHFKAIVKDDPASPYTPKVMFALGEYYFDNSDYFNALQSFLDYIHSYPKDKGAVFAKLIIYKIIADINIDKKEVQDEKEDALIKEIRKELFSQPLFLIFYDKKFPRSYKSLFGNSYLVYDYVDKIKVLRNGKIFLELSP